MYEGFGIESGFQRCHRNAKEAGIKTQVSLNIHDKELSLHKIQDCSFHSFEEVVQFNLKGDLAIQNYQESLELNPNNGISKNPFSQDFPILSESICYLDSMLWLFCNSLWPGVGFLSLHMLHPTGHKPRHTLGII